MADINTVIAKTTDALDEARAVAGLSGITAELSAKTAQIAALEAKLASALTLVDEAIAADTLADQAEAQRLAAARAALQ
jgi:hypothetical protein